MLHESRISIVALAVLSLLAACSRDGPSAPPSPPAQEITNKLAVPPEVVANLGITFVEATRGKVGSWVSVPGELYVPGTHRSSLRAPADGLLKSTLPRWSEVEIGDVVAELVSPKLREVQQELLAALSGQARAVEEAEAARARFAESETRLEEAKKLESASRKRFDHLLELSEGSKAFGEKERVEAQRTTLEASQTVLNAAVQRDALREDSRDEDLSLAQAQLGVDQRLNAFAILSGRTVEELEEVRDGVATWRTVDSILLRSPRAGTVVEISASQGELVKEGKLVADVMDSSGLRFRGWVPEGDLSLLRRGAQVRIELPGDLPPVTSELLGPMPVADSSTRRVQVEAVVPNPERLLPEGLSATAFVKVAESAHEEVLLPRDCVVLDGLEAIAFRRDPSDPGFVLRTPVEIGLRGADTVEVLAGVLDGDAVVQKGVYQLKQTGMGKTPQGGHVHADGTWHESHE